MLYIYESEENKILFVVSQNNYMIFYSNILLWHVQMTVV